MRCYVLKEDRRARFEKVRVPLPRPGWRERLSDWANEVHPRATTVPAYEFSVGKYTPTGERTRTWEFLRISVEDYRAGAETQEVTPVLVMKSGTGKRWWWYLGRLFCEDEELTASQLHDRVLELDRSARRGRPARRAVTR